MVCVFTSGPAEGDAQRSGHSKDGGNQRRPQPFLQRQPRAAGHASVRHTDHQRAAEDQRSHGALQRTRSHSAEVRHLLHAPLQCDSFFHLTSTLWMNPFILQGHPLLCRLLPSVCAPAQARPALSWGPIRAFLLVLYVRLLGWMRRCRGCQPLRWWGWSMFGV